MAAGYLLHINDHRIRTSEALYQACRFPHLPDIQRRILNEASPMAAKMVSKPYRSQSRPDWDYVRVKVMRWCLVAKLIQNWDAFASLLLSTKNAAIVEESRKDSFWGAIPCGDERLEGHNALGRLLMEIREGIIYGRLSPNTVLKPLEIEHFWLLGYPIEAVSGRVNPSQHLKPDESSNQSLSLFSESVTQDWITNTKPERSNILGDEKSESRSSERRKE